MAAAPTRPASRSAPVTAPPATRREEPQMRATKNLKNSADDGKKTVLAVGYPGSGKTTQIQTLPGRKFGYIFDPNAHRSLAGLDIDYAEFLPTHMEMDLAVKTLKKGIGDAPSMKRLEPRVYEDWLSDFIARCDAGFFDTIDWLVWDSFTTWAYSINDRLAWLNKRMGSQPQQDDWAAQINHISNVWRVVSSLPCSIYCTAHMDPRKNDITGRTYNHLMMTGQLRTRIPLLFSDIFVFHANSDEQGPYFEIQTAPDRENPTVRTSVKGLSVFEDVTIDWSQPTEGQGLAAILRRKPVQAAQQKGKH